MALHSAEPAVYRQVATVRNVPMELLTEKAWSQTVMGALRVRGWLAYRTWNSKHSPAGFPDICAVHVGQKRVVWLELKRERGKLSEKQRHWRDALIEAGQEHYVVRPSGWPALQRVMAGELFVRGLGE